MLDDLFEDRPMSPELLRAAQGVLGEGRRTLWELPDQMHCSVVGTCLDRRDVSALMRKAKLRLPEGTSDYEIHSWFVCQVVRDCPLSRITNKHLDRKFASSLRRYAKLENHAAVLQFWEEARRGRDLPGAYWTILSQWQTSDKLRRRLFGDIHMMSHFMIGRNRQDSRAVLLGEERIAQLEDRLTRVRQRHQDALAERDKQIETLEQEVLALRATVVRQSIQPTAKLPRHGGCKTSRTLETQRRRVAATRAMMRELQTENDHLRRQVAVLTEIEDAAPPAAAEATQPAGIEVNAKGRNWLYIGGRNHTLPHLRRGAAAFDVDLDFHDGGLEQSLHILDDLVARADIVFCPVDCVSHGACLKAKRLCRRLSKSFVPLRSASTSHFRSVATKLVQGATAINAERSARETTTCTSP